MTLEREKVSVSNVDSAITYVRELVSMFRRRGVKSEYAMPKVAELLDLSPKRVKSLYYSDGVWNVLEKELHKIEVRFDAYLDHEIALAAEYTETLRAKKRQLNLVLECKNESQRYSGYGSTDSLARLAG